MFPRAAATLLLTLLLPLIGVALAGFDLEPFLEIPPEGQLQVYPGFSWLAFVGIWVLFALLVAVWWAGSPRDTTSEDQPPEISAAGGFPLWGWGGLGLCLAFWWMAWAPTESEWLRRYTFPPLWLGYVIVVNALLVWRTGRCPMTSEAGFFLMLFPVSAAFWWLFEYLNRYVNNWVYLHASEIGAVEYLTHATLSFATVLPAVYSTYRLIYSFHPLQRRLSQGPALHLPVPRCLGLLLLVGFGGALASIGIAPAYLFPFLWIGPLGLWVGFELIQSRRLPWPELNKGDWRVFISWALAALICGFFWELWNLYAMPKWTYQIPWFERFYLFEMPISGYLGYLPFGLECGIVVMVCRAAYDRLRRNENRRSQVPSN